jgi:hypothetical protein
MSKEKEAYNRLHKFLFDRTERLFPLQVCLLSFLVMTPEDSGKFFEMRYITP